MKMFLTALFGLSCLGPYAVMGESYSWIPDRVPRLSQQCINLNHGYVGACRELQRNTLLIKPHYVVRNVCSSLKCAERRQTDGGYNSITHGKPLDGTICGLLKACHHGNCVDIPPSRIPTTTGAVTEYTCEPESIRPTVIRKTPTYSAARPSRKM